MSDAFKPYLQKLVSHETLSRAETTEAFSIMMAGEATMAQMGGFLAALRLRGETVDEIAGAAMAMQARMVPLAAPDDAMDIVGTGGDRSGSYNISTAAAFVIAAVGIPVAKHGNRAASSKSGSADVLTALGFDLDASFETVSGSIHKAGFGFMLAQRHHGAVRNVMPARIDLGTPTLFNFLGPLCNPASVKMAVIGCFDRNYLEKLVRTAKMLGMTRCLLVNGDGAEEGTTLDEASISGESLCYQLIDGEVKVERITPEQAGLERRARPAILGGTAEENAKALLGVLSPDDNLYPDYRDVVLLNAGLAIKLNGKAETLKQATALAKQAVLSGKALEVLHEARTITPL